MSKDEICEYHLMLADRVKELRDSAKWQSLKLWILILLNGVVLGDKIFALF